MSDSRTIDPLPRRSAVGRFAVRHATSISFLIAGLCMAGAYAASVMSSSVFPQTNFPRVVVLVDNGVMPADEMMATVTRPIEEAMKDIPGSVTVRSSTGRGSAEVNVFFTWNVDMTQSELYVLGRLSQIRATLPTTATASVYRLTFNAFPIIGVSLTSETRDVTDLWEKARYDIKPRFLRVPGVARVDLVGGRTPEYHVIADPAKLLARKLTLVQVSNALSKNNLVTPTGMHEEEHKLFLVVVDGRAHSIADIENFVISADGPNVVKISDIARVERGPEPVFNVVTAAGQNAVLLNIRSQPDGSALDIADQLKQELSALRKDLPPDLKLAFFYDQSTLVRASVKSVWEAIGFGLVLSIVILYLFLRNWGTVLVATAVIPVTVLFTLLAMKLTGLTFNLMTLGGIAAAIGLVIDDAIVVVEAIYTKIVAGLGRLEAVQSALAEILPPLIGSTLTPVVVFLPLTYLAGIEGVFFRALAITMVVALLSSLLLAVFLTPSLAARLVKIPSDRAKAGNAHAEEGGFVLRRVIRLYEMTVRLALTHRWFTIAISLVILVATAILYTRIESDFLPQMDEGGFVIDYEATPGTSLEETNRQLLEAEAILRKLPEVESYSRRTGARLALAIAEPHTGDFLVKLKADRERSTDEVVSELRGKFHEAVPGLSWEFPGILADLIGDLTWSPEPIEVKLFSNDEKVLKENAPRIKEVLESVHGTVDAHDGLIYAGPTLSLKVRHTDAHRFGLEADDIAASVSIAMLGQVTSSLLEGDRVVNIRVTVDPKRLDRIATLKELPLRGADGTIIKLAQVADIVEEPGQLELRRENLRQNVAVTARLEGRDLGSAMAEVREKLSKDTSLPPGAIEFGGLFQQQQESFRNLLIVLAMAVLLVFTVLLIEFRSITQPLAIVFGALLALSGSVLALKVTGTRLSIVAHLGAIIGVGIVAKNGILMLDLVDHLREQGMSLREALVQSGRRRLRPVLMTSLAAALGMLPLAYGIGSGADMLKPMAVAVIGAVCISVLLSLIATPVAYSILARSSPPRENANSSPHGPAVERSFERVLK